MFCYNFPRLTFSFAIYSPINNIRLPDYPHWILNGFQTFQLPRIKSRYKISLPILYIVDSPCIYVTCGSELSYWVLMAATSALCGKAVFKGHDNPNFGHLRGTGSSRVADF
jgi:hypothetical protein